MRQFYRYLLFIVLTGCLAAACEDDDEYEYPSVKLEFLTAYSDASGQLARIRTDEGELLDVVARTSSATTTPDSVIRIITNYEPAVATDGTQGVKLYGWSTAVSPLPKPLDETEEVKEEPAEVLSAWMGWEYLNVLLSVKQQGVHTIGFVERSFAVNADSREAIARLSLYHGVNSSVQDYSKRLYLSIPLAQYLTDEVDKLTVHFILTTESGEEKTYSFDVINHQQL